MYVCICVYVWWKCLSFMYTVHTKKSRSICQWDALNRSIESSDRIQRIKEKERQREKVVQDEASVLIFTELIQICKILHQRMISKFDRCSKF